MATRSDVARRAGVSAAVVSYVLNDGPRPVAAATKERVLAAMVELDYRPNAIARALRARRTWTLGFVVPDLANPFFAELAGAVENSAFARGYAVLIGSSGEDADRERKYIRTFLGRQVDGLLLISVRSAPDLGAAATTGTAVLVLDRSSPGTTTDLIVDDAQGALMGVNHLISHGHQRIGCIAGPADVEAAEDRRGGWMRALSEAGLEASTSLEARSMFTRAGGYEAARELLSRVVRPTAVFASSDAQGIGALRAAADLSLRVPEDLAVLAFDGTEDSAYTVPRLSTMAQPVTEIAERALNHLAARIAGIPDTEQHPPLPLRLITRRSCGCADPIRP